MKLPFKAPVIQLTRQFSAVVLSLFLTGFSFELSTSQAALAIGVDSAGVSNSSRAIPDCSDSGMLVAVSSRDQKKSLGNCPLKHTDVNAEVSGYVARVSVKQQFHNPFKEKIEAVYTFPLPNDAAVDEMTMKIGSRIIKGSIKKKEEARETYEAAKARGRVASLLDQERPNIFTQSVANIEPGENIDIEIKYVNILKYEDGAYTFNFPTVVGPRFIPGNRVVGNSGTGTALDTNEVSDASKITPPIAPQGQRAGHDISINLNINAGVPIQSVQSKLHEVIIERRGSSTAHIKLKNQDKIPNKDFLASWTVAGDAVQSGYLTHREGNEGFFTMMLVPPKRVTPKTVQPKEMIFVIDCSGSQSGLPIQKAKETMDYILNHMNPSDTFQIITFNSGVTQFAEHPELASTAMREKAHSFIDGLHAMGGTWMQPAVEKACAMPNDQHRLRIITFMTDGYVGNDMEILGLIKKYRGQTRWFSFGTGNAVNRFLIDGIAREGGGEAEYVLLNSSAEEVGKKFYDRISSPVLTDIKVEFEGVEAKEVFPKDLSDLWAQRPLNFTGRYTKPGAGKVILSGYSGGKPYKQEMKLEFPDKQQSNDVLPSIWARAKVERLMHEDWRGVHTGMLNEELKNEIINTALKYHIMSQFTSFVAVEEERTTGSSKPKLVPVQVEMPEGVQMEPRGFAYKRRAMMQAAGTYLAHERSSSGNKYSAGPLGAPAPVRAGGGGGGGEAHGGAYSSASPSPSNGRFAFAAPYNAFVRSPSGLPSTNMGKLAHQPGDNQYAAPTQVSGELLSRTSGSYGVTGSYTSRQAKAKFYQAPKEIQIIDNRPVVKDFRAIEQEMKAPISQLKSGEKKQESAANKLSKIDPSLLSLLEQLRTSQKSNQNLLRNGKLLITVELTDSPGSNLLETLRTFGLEITKRHGKFVIGTIDPSKIQLLSKIPEVVFIKL